MKGFKFDVKSVDKGYDQYKKNIKDNPKGSVKVGLLDGSKNTRNDGEEMTNAEIGIVHEYGTERVPARPFIRPAFEKHYRAYLRDALQLVKGDKTRKPMRVSKVLGIFGAKLAADMKNFVTQGAPIPPPLAASTLKRKKKKTRRGSKREPRPLIDTGRMIGSITWKVSK